jgi:hypothetical protein
MNADQKGQTQKEFEIETRQIRLDRTTFIFLLLWPVSDSCNPRLSAAN